MSDASAIAVVADADTLFGGTTRGLLIHLDYEGLIELHWSALILDEMSRALVRSKRQRDLQHAAAHEAIMRHSLPNAEVDAAAIRLSLPKALDAVRSPKDAHVAACALRVRASVMTLGGDVVALLSKNLKDFRAQRLVDLGVRLEHPDAFLSRLFASHPARVARAVRKYRSPLRSGEAISTTLERLALDGQLQTALMLDCAMQAGDIDL
ncbi:PIN domain-containing protein [Roseateles sp.]|uniref:PIN domain-containing protein n=1 Tax=Roseateles sp. TaxID=1971397 RepID=UPI0031E2A028